MAREDLERKAQPVLERSAVLIGALIGQRRDEARQQVAVRAVQLEHVEAGVDAHPRGGHEVAHARAPCRRASSPGAPATAARSAAPTGPITSQPSSSSGMSVPSQGSLIEPFRPACPSCRQISRGALLVHEGHDAPPRRHVLGAYMPVQPSVMRASGDTQVISVMTRPAPPSARVPRCTRWKSFGVPSTALYMSIGETTTRFGDRHGRAARTA